MTKEVATYQFGKDNQRVQVQGGKEWWCVKDACSILGIQNVTDATKHIPSSHLGRIEVAHPNTKSRCKTWKMLFVDEAGLNHIIMRSDKPQAQRYQEWVFSIVLPSIRKTGSYSLPQSKPTTDTLSELQVLKSAISILEQHETRLNAIEAKMAQTTQAPKLLPQTTLSKRAQFNMATRDMAKALNLSHQECYGEVYRGYYYTNHINLKERAKHTHIRPIDVAEQLGCFDDLINICNEMKGRNR